MLASVQAPVVGPELPDKGVDNLEHIFGVKAGVQPFIAFIVGAAVELVLGHKQVIVPVEQLAHQHKILFNRVAVPAQRSQEILLQTVGNVKSEPVRYQIPLPKSPHIQEYSLRRRDCAD